MKTNNFHIKKILKWIYLALFIFLSSAIIYFSAASGEQSSAQSGVFVDLLTSFLRIFNVELDQAGIDLVSLLIRKIIGHFLLFAVDGIFGYLTLLEFKLFAKKHINLIIIISIMAILAFGSEAIQLLADERGASLLDVALDMVGVLFGIGLVHLFYFHKSDKKKIGQNEGVAL